MKLILKIIYNLLIFIDKITLRLFKRSVMYYFKKLYENDLYIKKKILNNQVSFYVPNEIIKWRVENFYKKEPETLDWIDNFDDKDKIIFWDIGANIGLFSIYAALKYDNIEIISFEPSTNNLRVLSRNISINNLQEKIA